MTKAHETAANDNEVLVLVGCGNVFRDLEIPDAERAMEVLRDFHARSGTLFEHCISELDFRD